MFKCLLVWGYTEASVRGGSDERRVRGESIVTGERGYGCYLLRMASQLLQPLPGLTVRNKSATSANVLGAISQNTEIICSQCFTSTFHTSTRPSSPAEAHLDSIRRKVWDVLCESPHTWQKYFSRDVHMAGLISARSLSVAKHTKLISICVRNYFLSVHLHLRNLEKKHLSWGFPPSLALWPSTIHTTCAQNQQTGWADGKER